jgi:hypothetical protein
MTKDAKIPIPEMLPRDVVPFLTKMFGARYPVLLTGGPGCAKTSLVEEAAEAAKFDCVTMHPVVSDPTDVKGLPCIGKHGDEAVFLPFGQFKKLLTATVPTLAFMDDLGHAPPAVQASYMQLFLARAINEHKISEHVTFVAATNRKQDKAGVTGILEPVKSRFHTIIPIGVDVDDWIQWGLKNDMPPDLLAFNKWRPNLLADFQPSSEIINSPCPRTVANLGNMVNLFGQTITFTMMAGAVGPGYAREYEAFRTIHRHLPSPDLCFANPGTVEIPPRDKPDMRFAFFSTLAYHVSAKTSKAFFKLISRVDEGEYGSLAVDIAKVKFPKIVSTREFAVWAQENTDLLYD